MQGENFLSGFTTGAVASLAGSGAKAMGFGSLGVVGTATVAGAEASALTGGNWMSGAMSGMNIGLLNHGYAVDQKTGKVTPFSNVGDDSGFDLYETGIWNADGTFTSTQASTIVDWPHASSNELNWALASIGIGLSAAEKTTFTMPSFVPKLLKSSSQLFNTAAKVGGMGLGAYNGYDTWMQYNNHEINFSQMLNEEASNALSTFGGEAGAAWGIGWEAGRTVVNTNWYQAFKYKTLMPFRQKFLGY
jgi:hypothetical protein